jgi:Tfp pilus assembly protein PilN
MAGEFKSSFIPKEPTRRHSRATSSGGSFVGLITTIILVLTVVMTAGSFLYYKFLQSRLESKISALAQAEEEFDPILIEELVRLDKKLHAADDLLDSHVALSNLFEELGALTSQSVRFDSFNYTYEREAQRITMSGMAESFGAVAHQSDVFGESRNFSNVIFSNLAVGEFGEVSFDFAATVNPGLTSYGVSQNTSL